LCRVHRDTGRRAGLNRTERQSDGGVGIRADAVLHSCKRSLANLVLQIPSCKFERVDESDRRKRPGISEPGIAQGGRMLPYVTHIPRFDRLVIGHANLEKLATGCRWAEGPAYFAAGRYLVWSDIPNNRMMRFDETDGSVSVFRSPSFNSNGNTTD